MATSQPRELRQERERELVRATRSLFDERGLLDAPVEEIARSVGIARGLIYRQFSSKEELYVLTVTDYLEELGAVLDAAVAETREPYAQLEQVACAYADFCQRYPAFLDATLSLMHRPALKLRETVSESVWLRLGAGMARCIGTLADVLRADAFAVEDPDYLANVLWTQTLGAMHLARIRVGMRRTAEGAPDLFAVSPEQVIRTCVDLTLAAVGGHRP
jgi:AcrR family transcriptional regulator